MQHTLPSSSSAALHPWPCHLRMRGALLTTPTSLGHLDAASCCGKSPCLGPAHHVTLGNVISYLGFSFQLCNRTGIRHPPPPQPPCISRRFRTHSGACWHPAASAPSHTNYPWLPRHNSQHKAERAGLEKPKTLIFNMSYMVINTMQCEPHPPRGPGNPPSPKSRAAPAPGEGVREKRADGKAPSLRTPGSGLPATLLGGSRGVKGFKMCCLRPQVQVSTWPSQSASPHRWECGGHSLPPPQGV